MIDGNSIYNLLMSLMFKKVLVSGDFHEQSTLVSQMIKMDSTGLVSSLTQFQVDCATVDLRVDTDSPTLDDTFEEWLENINSEYRGKGIEVGIKGLQKEYYKEIWRGSSFPVLKILRWGEINGMNFPVSMAFVDGGSVYAEKKDTTEAIDLFAYDYYVGKDKKEKITGKPFFMYKPFSIDKDEFVLCKIDKEIHLLKISELENYSKNNIEVPTYKDGKLEWKEATLFSHSFKGNMFKVKLTTGNFEVNVTNGHSLMIWDSENKILVEKKVQECKVGDYLLVPKNKFLNNNKRYEFILNKRKNLYVTKQIKVKLNEELAYFLGFYVADGCGSQRNNKSGRINLFPGKDIKITNKLLKIGRKIFGKGNIRKDKNCYVIEFYGKELKDWFEEVCGKYAENKKVPTMIFNSPLKIQQAFLKGYIAGDGSENKKRNKYSFITISKELMNGLVILLKNNEYNINCYEVEAHEAIFNKRKINCKKSYRGEFFNNKRNLGIPFRVVGWNDKRGVQRISSKTLVNCKKGSYFKDFEWDFKQIKEISCYDYEGKVYDMEVKDNATFVAGLGQILVHNSRWFDKYPTPYLIERGIYKNWKIIDMVKDKEIELIERIIPYMLLVLKGSEALSLQGTTYSAPELEGVKTKIQEMMDKLNTLSLNLNGQTNKTPIRVSNWDEEIKHLIPDLESMFKRALFEGAEKNILAGLGFIDIAESVSSSRKESVLNPKVFIKECSARQKDFMETVLGDLLALIKEKNSDSRKYTAKKWIVSYNPTTEFMSEDFRGLIRSLSDRGMVSNETADYICSQGTINYEIEKRNRIRETKDGDETLMYPKLIQNTEQATTMEEETHRTQYPKSVKQEKLDLEKQGKKKGTPEAQNFNQSELEIDELTDDSLIFLDNSEITLELSKWQKNRVTENYIRRGQINPDKFEKNAMRNGQTFATIGIKESKGIKGIIGKLKGQEGTHVQSYLFDKTKWTTEEADQWLEKRKKATLEGSPYAEIGDLPPSVRKRLNLEKQKMWLAVWNSAYKFYLNKLGDAKKAEILAFKTAWNRARHTSKKKLEQSELETSEDNKELSLLERLFKKLLRS